MARFIANKIGTTPTHLDSLHWLPGWVENTPEIESETLQNVLNQDKWVIDGNYSKVLYDKRLELADTIIFLDFNRFLCFKRILKRYFNYKGRTREDMGKGCDEKIDFEFVSWVLHKGRKNRKKYLRRLDEAGRKYPGNKYLYLKTRSRFRSLLRTNVLIFRRKQV